MMREQSKRVYVYGRTDEAVQKALAEWAMSSRGQVKTTFPALTYVHVRVSLP